MPHLECCVIQSETSDLDTQSKRRAEMRPTGLIPVLTILIIHNIGFNLSSSKSFSDDAKKGYNASSYICMQCTLYPFPEMLSHLQLIILQRHHGLGSIQLPGHLLLAAGRADRPGPAHHLRRGPRHQRAALLRPLHIQIHCWLQLQQLQQQLQQLQLQQEEAQHWQPPPSGCWVLEHLQQVTNEFTDSCIV